MRNSKLPGLLSALTLAAAAPSPAQSGPVSVPFTTNRDAMVIIPATVAGTMAVHLIFDTGAGLDILAPSIIRAAHGTRAGEFHGTRMTGERVDIPLFTLPDLTVGPMTTKHAVVGGWDVLDSLHVDGIVSVNRFRRRPVTIDFADTVVTFETSQSLARRRAAGPSVPLRLDDLGGQALDLFAQFRIDNHPGACEIDTGSYSATIHARYLPLLGVRPGDTNVVKRERHTIAGATQITYSAGVRTIALAGTPNIAQAGPRVAFSDIIYDCVIGNEFWRGRIVTFDIAGRTLTVSGPKG